MSGRRSCPSATEWRSRVRRRRRAPIPTSDGVIEKRDLEHLVDLPPGIAAIVREVADEDAAQLRRLTAIGLNLGTAVEVSDVVCTRITDALDLLLKPKRLIATLRS